ncbi:MAG: phosphotransferase family protein [Myxococcota bacterium]
MARWLVPGGTLVGCRALEGGVSASVHLLEVSGPGQGLRRVVVRRHGAQDWKPRHGQVTATEYGLMRALGGLGLPVPAALALDESCERLPTPYFVMDYVEGQTDIPAEALPDALGRMASFLAGLHALDPSRVELPGLPRIEDPREGALQYLPSSRPYAALRAELADAPSSTATRSVLHGDFWPGNVLWHGGRIAAVIDWEDASTGDAMSDLASARVELRCAHGDAAMQAFTDHYAAKRAVDPERLALWEIYASSAALATMSEWGLPAPDEHARRRGTQRALDQAVAAWTARR